MTITKQIRKIVDKKVWEPLSFAPAASFNGSSVAETFCKRQIFLVNTSGTQFFLYTPDSDLYIQIADPALAGSFNVGFSSVGVNWSTGATVGVSSLTATGGSSTTLVTNQTLAVNLAGHQIQLLSGPGAGDIRTISSNTFGANATITVSSAFSASPTASTTYRLLTPRWIVFNPGAQSSGSVKQYDYATNTWTSLGFIATTTATDGRMVSTCGYRNLTFNSVATGTSTGTNTTTTLNNTGKSWTTNQWTNSQVRITGGTGAGQIRSISSNTGTALTVSTAWTITPDATSTYAIEGNDDYVYWTGNNSNLLQRYSFASNSWTQVGSARGGTATTGMSLAWFYRVTDSTWTAENSIINGRRIYGFRGGTAVMDYYDIASASWTNITYAPGQETYGAGSSYVCDGKVQYIQKDATGRWFTFDPAANEIKPWNVCTIAQGPGYLGERAFLSEFVDGSDSVQYVNHWLNNSDRVLRSLVI